MSYIFKLYLEISFSLKGLADKCFCFCLFEAIRRDGADAHATSRRAVASGALANERHVLGGEANERRPEPGGAMLPERGWRRDRLVLERGRVRGAHALVGRQ